MANGHNPKTITFTEGEKDLLVQALQSWSQMHSQMREIVANDRYYTDDEKRMTGSALSVIIAATNSLLTKVENA